MPLRESDIGGLGYFSAAADPQDLGMGVGGMAAALGIAAAATWVSSQLGHISIIGPILKAVTKPLASVLQNRALDEYHRRSVKMTSTAAGIGAASRVIGQSSLDVVERLFPALHSLWHEAIPARITHANRHVGQAVRAAKAEAVAAHRIAVAARHAAVHAEHGVAHAVAVAEHPWPRVEPRVKELIRGVPSVGTKTVREIAGAIARARIKAFAGTQA